MNVHTEGKPSSVRAVLFAAFLAGTLDILAAFIQAYLASDVTPGAVLRYIASGVFGQDAFSGGVPMALWGLLFHFCIASFWTLAYFSLYPLIRKTTLNKYSAGLLYGIVIGAVMNFVVLPLSNIPPRTITFAGITRAIAILMVCVGIPVAWKAHDYYSAVEKRNTVGS